ncbi:hypothetical protein [Streptomyces griseus]|uniref:hypothetical protein n=1 Tax=Streptomyces griseus TaxID=1911 RepID=UPI001112C90C|nr:hypothetical protein [Streptomyces griseus]
MTTDTVVRGQRFNSGGQGTVWAVRDRTLNGSWPVAYKEYHSRIRAGLDPGVLAAMVDFIPSLPPGTGRWLADCAAWPAVLVTDSQGVSGFLMRQIPERFFVRLAFAPEESRPAGFQYLLNPASYFAVAGFTITPRQRFELLLDFARTLGRLHSLGVVVGDVSPNNVLFSLEGAPRCFLIDCDAMALRGTWALPPVDTPGWDLPPGERMGRWTGDAYKFGLLAARLFAGSQDGQDLAVLRATDPAVALLAERSLHSDPFRRPCLEQWLQALAAAVTAAPAVLPTPPRSGQQPTTPSAPQGGAAAPQGPPLTVANTPPVAPRLPHAPRPVPARPPRSRAGRRLVAVGLVVLALVYGPDLLREFGEGSGSTGTGSYGQDVGPDGSASSAPRTEEAQVRALGGLLERNEGNRSDVGAAVRRLTTCPGRSGLREAEGVFQDAATEREELVRDLEALDADLLPDSLTGSLRSGWRASAEADRAYARLAGEVMSGCTPEAVQASVHWRDASRANTRATRAKQDFVGAWNPVAEGYGLSAMAWDEV